jgi:uroporphyrin-III C-methyltransferase
MKGILYIVGAGLKADLITVRGLKIINKADIILYDRLIDIKLLKDYKGKKINVGKLPYSHSEQQSHINELIEKYLMKGQKVVRLKGGDSVIFSRALEEIEVAKKIGAKIEIVPGITSASVAITKIEGALTDRRFSSGVIFITGHSCKNDIEKSYNWHLLSELKLTIAIYMGAKNTAFIINNLVESGLPGETSVLIAEKLESKDEKTTLTRADKAVESLANVSFPVITIIGDVIKASGIMLDN